MVSSHLIPDHSPVTRGLSFLQINLQHSRAASAALAQEILENKFDIVLVQETYAFLSPTLTVTNIPPGCVAFHALDHDHAFGALILVRLAVALERGLLIEALLTMWRLSTYAFQGVLYEYSHYPFATPAQIPPHCSVISFQKFRRPIYS